MTERNWTPTEYALLDLMISLGASHKDIALRLGRSEKVVQRQASRRGLLKRDAEREARRQAEEARLRATEADLSEFHVSCEEEPADRPYERYKARNRAYAERNRERIRQQQREKYAEDEKYRERRKANAKRQQKNGEAA